MKIIAFQVRASPVWLYGTEASAVILRKLLVRISHKDLTLR